MYYLIYQITNKINGMIYIGKHQTENKNDDYMGSGKYLGYAIKKEGIENFEKTILFECQSEEEMNRKEAELVNEEFVNRDDTYNITLGGNGGWNYINSNSLQGGRQKYNGQLFVNIVGKNTKGIEIAREKLRTNSEFRKEFSKLVSNGIKNHIKEYGHWWTGKHHTEKTKQKMSEIFRANHHQQGSKNSQYGKHWWMNPETGESKLFSKTDPIPEGWIRGRQCNLSKESRKVIIENGRKVKHNNTAGYK